MQIDYNQYIIELEREEKEAKVKFEAAGWRPCRAERFGRWEGLKKALILVVTLTRAEIDAQIVCEALSSQMRVQWEPERCTPFNQRYYFGCALGFAAAYNLLREHVARTMHVVPMRELQAPKEVTVIWHQS